MDLSNEQLNQTSAVFPGSSSWIPGVEESTPPGVPGEDSSEAMPAMALDSEKAPANTELYQPAMRIEIPALPTPSTETTDGFFKQRPWQAECSVALAEQRNFILNAPTAAGKTFQLCTIAAERLRRDSDLKVVIAAPQGIITAGFRHNKIELPDGSRIRWDMHPNNDLSAGRSRRSTARLLKILNGPTSANEMDRVTLCTHATLVRAFTKDPAAFKNVLVIIDEAHHVQHGTAGDLAIHNKLGALVKHALEHCDIIRVGLATATFFRGDRAPIVPDGAEFARFDLAYDEYLQSCEFLRGLSYDFVISGSSFVDPLKHLFDRRIGKTIVYIPAVNSASSLGTKSEDVNGVLKAIAGTEVPILADSDQPIMQVKRGDRWIRVVNLVEETNRAKKIEAIIAAHNAPDSGHIDVVIALGMLKEGANWRWADREVIIGPRGSLTEILQMVGRILRDVPGKTTVEVFHLLPFRFDQTDKERTRQDLNDYLTAILLSMLLENVVSPAYLPPADQDGSRDGGRQRINYFKEAFTDEGQATAALAEITSRVVDANANDCTSQGIQQLTEVFPAIVSEVLAARGVQERHEQIARQLFRMFSRRTVALEGLNVGHVDVNLIKENPFGCLLQYASDACGINTFRELRAASCGRAFLPFDTARAFVQSLGLKSSADWREYCGSGQKPADIPSNPDLTYEHRGWTSFGDWLGTGTVSLAKRIYRSFQEAREFVHTLQLNSQGDWTRYCASGKKPTDIPAKPELVYEDKGWVGFGDWLGTGTVATFRREYRSFEEARGFVRSLGLRNQGDWALYRKSASMPADIPTNPNVVYRETGWKGHGDWLGTERAANRYKAFRPFQEAREYVHDLRLKSYVDWLNYCKTADKPVDIPHHPDRTYRDQGWSGWGDWLGTGRVANRDRRFRSFQEARAYTRSLGLKSVVEWQAYAGSEKLPSDIPSSPAQVYKHDGWAGFGDWLGTGRIADHDKNFRPFDKAREYVRSLGLRTVADWRKFSKSGKRPPDMPATPDQVYKGAGWAGYKDWLTSESGCTTAAA